MSLTLKTKNRDKSLDTLRGNLGLSIQLKSGGLCFCIYNHLIHRMLAVYEYTSTGTLQVSDVNEIFEQNDLFKNTFVKVTAGFSNLNFTLVPSELYNEKQIHEYASINFGFSDTEVLVSQTLKNLNAVAIYTIPQKIKTLLGKRWSDISWTHPSSSFIETLFRDNRIDGVFVYLEEDSMCISVIGDGKLKLYNSFEYKSAEEFIYYVLLVYEQAGINLDIVVLTLYGNISKTNENYEYLYKYVRNISFGQKNTNFTYSFELDSIPEHYFSILFNQHLCL
ncbi:DUF3822 family protein [Ichthyobacterium seriolicida]|uniref:DUF3822 domain-containing protein n=1 Tax=Ichthyobacterium seriolicida TaxID=242600 RepID=A0A1J1DWU4_9FLAO|nr:DUF3822 family protein [Ichthyobacterium seriolicida]BAV94330.1 hypothetical protein JBKA6_0317 [Ichthyobacterium seriolicida]